MRALLIAAVLALAVTAGAGAHVSRARLAYVIDGDTIALTSGLHVRLVQIDTPELESGECYARAAARDLRRLLPAGATLTLEDDARLDRVDRYGRLLRYLWYGGRNLNLRLVRDGSATVWLYHGDRGKYAAQLLAAARAARAARRGLWGACDAIWDPYGPATTFPKRRR